MGEITNLRAKIDYCLNAFLSRNKEKFPKYAIVNNKVYTELGEMIIPGIGNKEYLSHDKGSERIEILAENQISEKQELKLEELIKTHKFPFILSKDKRIDPDKDMIVDLSNEAEDIEKYLSQKQ